MGGGGRILEGEKRRNGDLLAKLDWLALETLWFKFNWWLWNQN